MLMKDDVVHQFIKCYVSVSRLVLHALLNYLHSTLTVSIYQSFSLPSMSITNVSSCLNQYMSKSVPMLLDTP